MILRLLGYRSRTPPAADDRSRKVPDVFKERGVIRDRHKKMKRKTCEDECDIEDPPDAGATRHPRSGEIISCTRRSDVPAHKMDWMLDAMRRGSVDVVNPRNWHWISTVDLSPAVVRCFAWWSKDYAPWIAAWRTEEGHALLSAYDAHLFNFTINGEASALEPGLATTLAQRLDQLRWLCQTFTPESVVLRFDPVVHYRVISQGPSAPVLDNMEHYREIMGSAAACGIRSVSFAFVNPYKRSIDRMRERGMELVVLTAEEKEPIVSVMAAEAKEFGVQLLACCQPEISEFEGIGTSSCVSGATIDGLLRAKKKRPLEHPSTRDTGGRYPKCHCTKSVEIGGYGKDFACSHSCAYCYANPA